MRIARTLVLALATALAAMALTASTASATHGTDVSLTNETTGANCSLAMQNCKIVAHSEATQETSLRGHLFGFESTDSVCDDEFTGYVGDDGSGHIVEQVLTGANCTREPCGTSVGNGSENEWPAHLAETGPENSGELTMEIEFCLETRPDHTDPIHCSLDVDVFLSGTPAHHDAEFLAEESDGDLHRPCHAFTGDARPEVRGHWVSDAAASDEIEVVHVH